MSTPSAKTTTSGGKGKTTTAVKTTTAAAAAAGQQVQPKSVRTTGAGAKVNKSKTTATGKKVINSHSNRPLSNGLMRFSRGRMFHRRALYRINKWKDSQAKLKDDKTKKTTGSIQKKKTRTPALKKQPIGGERNGKERLVRTKRFVIIQISVRCMTCIDLIFYLSLVTIQQKNDRRNSPSNVNVSPIIHVVFDHRSHLAQLSFLLPANMLAK
jgi:hypothetical protein